MSEGHQVIAQDTVTDTIGHLSVKGQDDINFTFTLYSGEEAVWRSTAASRENTTKNWSTLNEVNKNTFFFFFEKYLSY